VTWRACEAAWCRPPVGPRGKLNEAEHERPAIAHAPQTIRGSRPHEFASAAIVSESGTSWRVKRSRRLTKDLEANRNRVRVRRHGALGYMLSEQRLIAAP